MWIQCKSKKCTYRQARSMCGTDFKRCKTPIDVHNAWRSFFFQYGSYKLPHISKYHHSINTLDPCESIVKSAEMKPKAQFLVSGSTTKFLLNSFFSLGLKMFRKFPIVKAGNENVSLYLFCLYIKLVDIMMLVECDSFPFRIGFDFPKLFLKMVKNIG